ncbi:ribosome maturation factor RimP [Leptospira bandrabouensis]|uniref:ribosome maturation factor RimP n=1 Tax=Leptospira bandrabouensis TaxID=2484903 RepID=UPI00223E159B|nr:ribosome maturation factor RimP [Leptospira bandrabouensis]MCW7460281.1 ribosome maturation factor RimP [Leptospira bandrabouensis]MCW7477678.1 ribosome maturation factor RimP [Leptospira bandrabouensis]MCW7485360.1 ribosome maturation factor RimP [Leptospira bandrabouensis]
MVYTEENIRELILRVLTPPLALFSLQVQNRKNHALIEIELDHLTDKTGSASLEDCENVSRRLKEELDLWGDEFDFTLQVSSAGAERVLRLPEDLSRFQGLLVKLEVPLETGKWDKRLYRLGPVSGDSVELTLYDRKTRHKKNQKSVLMPIAEIRKGNLYLEI